ncbi:DUF6491 family protein [Lysobacter yangpyeongensis]|uniref:DUF6491 family protein n=1 Tax=Lysobacter yangpyeongensis TaxID=346182 RepID=A0ABW0SPP3_9GAMM
MKLSHITLAALAFAFSACASGGMTDTEKLALYRAHALAPVPSFHYLGRIDGWTPLGDTAVAVWTRPNVAYLLEVDGPCPDLDFASAIGLTNQSGTVYSRFDKVIPRTHGGANPIPCHIGQIRPLDVKAIKSAEKDMRRQRDNG